MRSEWADLIWTVLPILVLSVVVALLIAGANSIDQIVWGR
jgi:hypothetical protein